MSVQLELPIITAKEPALQIDEIKRYLYTLVEKLNWALNTTSDEPAQNSREETIDDAPLNVSTENLALHLSGKTDSISSSLGSLYNSVNTIDGKVTPTEFNTGTWSSGTRNLNTALGKRVFIAEFNYKDGETTRYGTMPLVKSTNNGTSLCGESAIYRNTSSTNVAVDIVRLVINFSTPASSSITENSISRIRLDTTGGTRTPYLSYTNGTVGITKITAII